MYRLRGNVRTLSRQPSHVACLFSYCRLFQLGVKQSASPYNLPTVECNQEFPLKMSTIHECLSQSFRSLLLGSLLTGQGVALAAPSAATISAQPYVQIDQLKKPQTLSAIRIHPTNEGWVRISEPDEKTGYFYAPFSIKAVKNGFVSVMTLINYISDEGDAESLLGVTVYDCVNRTKQEQSTVQYSQQWADGEIKYKAGLEEEWGSVKVGSDGMRLLKIICNL